MNLTTSSTSILALVKLDYFLGKLTLEIQSKILIQNLCTSFSGPLPANRLNC